MARDLYDEENTSDLFQTQVSIEGNIGSGKTTLLNQLSKLKYVETFEEPIAKWQNLNGRNLLDDFYRDPTKNSFPFQSYVTITMLENHLAKTNKPIKLMERFTVRCFTEVLKRNSTISLPEYEVFSSWFQFIENHFHPEIDSIIYLETSPQEAFRRIQQRNRREKNFINLEYLEQMHQSHENWLVNRSCPFPVLVIDADNSPDEVLRTCNVFLSGML